MTELRELYQELILDHHKRPRNFGSLSEANRSATGFNPLCGDRVTIQLRLDAQDRIADIRFEGSGCAISTATASLLTEGVKGKSKRQAQELFDEFHRLIVGAESEGRRADAAKLGKLAVLAGVREFPTRVKCATLAWHTLHAALAGDHDSITTE